MARRLRSGYTTGACAAAAARAALELLLGAKALEEVEIPFPDGSRVSFAVAAQELGRDGQPWARATVIKDAGDDPDVTNGAAISATVQWLDDNAPSSGNCVELSDRLLLCGGAGVGRVTKPGLPVSVGEPAINPVPRRMICEALLEVLPQAHRLQVTIGVADGEQLAEKTLNRRLGIVDGLSILGTTGIVRPVSAEAWTATIEASMAVARSAGLTEVVLSTGRTSEKGVQALLDLPEEAYAMMGDYLEFSLKAAASHGFTKIHLAGMWAKVMKAALRVPQTHVRHGALEIEDGLRLLAGMGVADEIMRQLEGANTAREIYQRLMELDQAEVVRQVCELARDFAGEVSGLAVDLYLVESGGKAVMHV